jgi:alpha-galactosidase
MELVPFEVVITIRKQNAVSNNAYQCAFSVVTAGSVVFLFVVFALFVSRDASTQSQRDALNWCYPSAPIKTTLNVLQTNLTANNFTTAAAGWNSWGIQADPGTTPNFTTFNQEFVLSQCTVLAESDFRAAGYDLCSLDSGWSDPTVTDEYGRIMYRSPQFNLSTLGSQLHGMGLKMGVYTLPGFPCSGLDKTIKETDIKLREVWNGNILGFGFCDFNFERSGVQEYHDSVIDLWTSWGVDMIKLDYMTPGSPKNNGHLVKDNSGAAVAYHNAIKNSGHQMRLDLSWKLCRTDEFMNIWASNAESMRIDQDLDSYNGKTFTNLASVQRTIENYRQFIALQAARNKPVSIHPDMDNLYVGNPEQVTGLSDSQRVTLMSLWIGASANLLLGSDLTNLDALGRRLITSPESVKTAEFCSRFPMQPRNPGTGANAARQLQAWISGPSDEGEAVVLLTNLGANEGRAGFRTRWKGVQKVEISLEDLGIGRGERWSVRNVWDGDVVNVTSGGSISAFLDEGESRMLWLSPC